MGRPLGPSSGWDGPVPQSFRSLLLLVLPLTLAPAGCAAARQDVVAYPRLAGSGQPGTVFAVDGAGGFEAASIELRRAIVLEGLPWTVETFDWSHGFGRVVADVTDREHTVASGQRLAGVIAARRQSCPCGEIYLLGHSAGCGVILAAAESLPPGYIDRIVLLAPALSAQYDLRPALRSVRRIEVFYSRRDRFYLGLGTTLFGTTDRCWGCPAAGRVGFCPVLACPEDVALYQRLRQHPWHPSLEASGNFGGHYGAYQLTFLRDYVLPLMSER